MITDVGVVFVVVEMDALVTTIELFAMKVCDVLGSTTTNDTLLGSTDPTVTPVVCVCLLELFEPEFKLINETYFLNFLSSCHKSEGFTDILM